MYMEFEKKGLITEDEFMKIIKKCNVKEVIVQENYYFETKDLYFKNNNAALRVRVKNNAYELTLKVQRSLGNLEYNYDITKEDFIKMKITMLVPKQLQKYVDRSLKLDTIKEIITERHIITFEDDIIELDKTTFKDTVDYEIEVEAVNMKRAQLIYDKFNEYVEVSPKESMPKIARYELYNK